MSDPSSEGQPREIPALAALVPISSLIAFLVVVILILPRYAPGFEGSGHIPLILAAAVAGIIGRLYGHDWEALQDGILDAIRMAMGAILILLVIGMLMGTWLASGVVPALIHWGLVLLDPSYFLPTTCLVCSIVSVVSGSSWSTAGTVGLALIGVGNAMGVDAAMTAGAVISGAYFGDKLSPLSDTTNLAPAMAGAELFEHIRHMTFSTVPAWLIAMVVYGILSAGLDQTAAPDTVAHIQGLIEQMFEPGFIHVIPPVVVLGLVLLRQPALPSLFSGVVLGAVVAVMGGVSVPAVLDAALGGYRSQTGDATVDELLSRGGMLNMASTVFLILSAMTFGGIMERTGMLKTLARKLLHLARSSASLITTTILTAAGMNIVAADQYIALVVPGRMYANAFAERGLHPKNLSRAIEDGGTITSPLIPWNTCGAFMSATLMVATPAYLPYAVFNLANPVISLVLAWMGWTIAPASDAPGTKKQIGERLSTPPDHRS